MEATSLKLALGSLNHVADTIHNFTPTPLAGSFVEPILARPKRETFFSETSYIFV
jgi:hypothetical protein